MAEGPARVQRGAGPGVDAILSGPGEGSATQVMLWQVVFHMWRDAARERPQSSVLTAVRPLRYAVVSTLRTLPPGRPLPHRSHQHRPATDQDARRAAGSPAGEPVRGPQRPPVVRAVEVDTFSPVLRGPRSIEDRAC